MAIALVSNATVTGPNGGTTGAIDTTGASLLVVFISEYSAGGVTVSDSKSNTWVGLTALTTRPARLFYVANPTVGTGHTFTATGSSSYSVLDVAAFSGAAIASPFDQQNGATGTPFNNTNAKPGSITPTEDNELIICGFSCDSAVTLTIDSGMTITNQTAHAGGNNFGGAMAYVVQTTAAAINPLWGFAGSTNAAIPIASFKAAAAAAVGAGSFRFAGPFEAPWLV